MNRRAAVLLLASAMIAVSCGSASTRGELAREAARALDKTSGEARRFTYIDQTLDQRQRVVVTGTTQDDFRYSGAVSLNDRPLYEMVVSDDAIALRLLDTTRAVSALRTVEVTDPPTARALQAGRWVVDYTAAPAIVIRAEANADEQAKSGAQERAPSSATLVGDDPFFDAAQLVQYAKRNVREALALVRFNPDSIDYNPADDPWRSDARQRLDDEGIIRYDVVQPPLPPRAQRGQRQQFPGVRHFRKMAIYVKGGVMSETREQIAIADRREFRRALEGRTAKYYVALRDAAESGALSDPLRERLMSYAVTGTSAEPVNLPKNAEKGILKDVVGDRGLKTLFKFTTIGGAASLPPGPVSGGQAPSPSPGK